MTPCSNWVPYTETWVANKQNQCTSQKKPSAFLFYCICGMVQKTKFNYKSLTSSFVTEKKSVFVFDLHYWNHYSQNSAHIFILLTTRMTYKQLRNDTNSGNWQVNVPAACCDLPLKRTCLRLCDVEKSAWHWRAEAETAKAEETRRTVAVRPSSATLRCTGQNAFSLSSLHYAPR